VKFGFVIIFLHSKSVCEKIYIFGEPCHGSDRYLLPLPLPSQEEARVISKKYQCGMFGGQSIDVTGFSFGGQSVIVTGFSFGRQSVNVTGFSFGEHSVNVTGFSFGGQSVNVIGFSFGRQSVNVTRFSFGGQSVNVTGFSLITLVPPYQKHCILPAAIPFIFLSPRLHNLAVDRVVN
jgi:hypothetical protein